MSQLLFVLAITAHTLCMCVYMQSDCFPLLVSPYSSPHLKKKQSLMDRRTLNRALQPLDRSAWLDLLPADRRIDLPDIGAFVIYYPEGHRVVCIMYILHI